MNLPYEQACPVSTGPKYGVDFDQRTVTYETGFFFPTCAFA